MGFFGGDWRENECVGGKVREGVGASTKTENSQGATLNAYRNERRKVGFEDFNLRA